MFYSKRSIILTLLGSLALLLGIGCEQAPKAIPTKELAPDEKIKLSSADRSEILNAFGSIAQGHEIVNRPSPAANGVRWSDVPQAAAAACSEVGVEMAIVETIKDDRQYTFIIRTVEDMPVEMIVRRVDDAQVYQATATVGWFRDDQKRADKLLAAFGQKMRAFGRKRGFNDE